MCAWRGKWSNILAVDSSHFSSVLCIFKYCWFHLLLFHLFSFPCSFPASELTLWLVICMKITNFHNITKLCSGNLGNAILSIMRFNQVLFRPKITHSLLNELYKKTATWLIWRAQDVWINFLIKTRLNAIIDVNSNNKQFYDYCSQWTDA